MSPEKFTRPKVARKAVMQLITEYGRQAHPHLPPQPVPIDDVLRLETEANLWFGPENDAIKFLYSRQTLGVLKIDEKNQTVIFTFQS